MASHSDFECMYSPDHIFQCDLLWLNQGADLNTAPSSSSKSESCVTETPLFRQSLSWDLGNSRTTLNMCLRQLSFMSLVRWWKLELYESKRKCKCLNHGESEIVYLIWWNSGRCIDSQIKHILTLQHISKVKMTNLRLKLFSSHSGLQRSVWRGGVADLHELRGQSLFNVFCIISSLRH